MLFDVGCMLFCGGFVGMSCILYNYYLVWFALGLVWVVCSSGFVFCWLLAFGLWVVGCVGGFLASVDYCGFIVW